MSSFTSQSHVKDIDYFTDEISKGGWTQSLAAIWRKNIQQAKHIILKTTHLILKATHIILKATHLILKATHLRSGQNGHCT